MRLVSLVLVVATGLLGCASELPPPPAPARSIPAIHLPEDRPVEGNGRVVLDAEGERAEVRSADSQTLCTTPCVVDLALGSHPLVFVSTADPSRTSDVDLDVGPEPKIVRHRMAERHDGGALHSLGFAVLVLGAVTTVSGITAWTTDLSEHGPVVTGIGGALLGGALSLLWVDRPTERPGSTTELPLTASTSISRH